MINGKGLGINIKKRSEEEERGQVLRQKEGSNKQAKGRESAQQHVAMKMHAKERNVLKLGLIKQYGMSGRSFFLMLRLPRKQRKRKR